MQLNPKPVLVLGLHCIALRQAAQAGFNHRIDVEFDCDFDFDSDFCSDSRPIEPQLQAQSEPVGLFRDLESSGNDNDTVSSFQFESSYWRRIIFTFDKYFHISSRQGAARHHNQPNTSQKR
jgi:hypothetical protein